MRQYRFRTKTFVWALILSMILLILPGCGETPPVVVDETPPPSQSTAPEETSDPPEATQPAKTTPKPGPHLRGSYRKPEGGGCSVGQ